MRVWDAKTGKELLTLKGHTGDVSSVAISLDGKRVASGSEDKTLKIWDSITGDELLTLKGLREGITAVAFSPDGKCIVAGTGIAVKVWEVAK